jgi:hypothetical protein
MLDRELIEGKMIARAENRSLQFLPPAGDRLAAFKRRSAKPVQWYTLPPRFIRPDAQKGNAR